MTREEFAGLVERFAPPERAFEWDNSGYNISLHDDIKKVFVCLDPTVRAVQAAQSAGCDTVLSHHPLLFRPIKKVMGNETVGGALCELIRSGMNLYCAHTSFDCAPDGMNAVLARLLGLRGVRSCGEDNIMTVGKLPQPLSPDELAQLIKQATGAASVKYNADAGAITSVACIGGAGGDYFAQAAREGAQALVTGEAKYNHYLDAAAYGVSIFAAGHNETEKQFAQYMTQGLQMLANELQLKLICVQYDAEQRPYRAV